MPVAIPATRDATPGLHAALPVARLIVVASRSVTSPVFIVILAAVAFGARVSARLGHAPI